MALTVKSFEDLTAADVYEILKARSAVFMLEQHILCLDMDDRDYESLHFFYREGKQITAYLRAFSPDGGADTLKIGRVLALPHGQGVGRAFMQDSLAYLWAHTACRTLLVDAQIQARGFYEKFGFRAISAEFEEEGVPHIAMALFRPGTDA